LARSLCPKTIVVGDFVSSISKEKRLLLTWFSVTFFSGFVLANSILICVSFIPLFIYLVGFFIAPIRIEVRKEGLPSVARLDEAIQVRIIGKLTGGLGAVVIFDEVAAPFQLVEGSNYMVVCKKIRANSFDFSYRIRCTKCGSYFLGLGWETMHILGLFSGEVSTERTRQLRVFPELPKVDRIRLPPRRTLRFQPGGSIARIGPLSTDFKEIRNYSYGDPFKFINWKASARAAGLGKQGLLVNEYEREGKQTIWLFLDSNPDLNIGTSAENVLQYTVRFAYIISYLFLSRGYSLGMYIYNRQGEAFHSDSGKGQFLKIADGLLKLASMKAGLQVFWNEGFAGAVERNQGYLVAQSPGIVVVTHIVPSNWNDLLVGLRKILSYRRLRKLSNVTVINILPYGVLSASSNLEMRAAEMLSETSKASSNKLRDLGFTVIDWDLKKDSQEAILLKTIRSR
jgi:uncharacterized protein (DUF58 family)